MPERAFSDAEVEAAVAALTDAERFREAQDIIARTAPALQRVLDEALAAGGWFGAAHEEQVQRAAAHDDDGERLRAVRTLLAEETRMGMLVGVAVGYELARELNRTDPKE